MENWGHFSIKFIRPFTQLFIFSTPVFLNKLFFT